MACSELVSVSGMFGDASGADTRGEGWLAIDFETASTRATPCSVGLAVVEGNSIVRSESWLIRPPIFEFAPINIGLHGIGPDMCQDAARWPETLDRILEFARGRLLVAHNAGFDIGVIRDACDACGLPWPDLDYACTMVMSRQIWPDLSSHSLPFVASHLGLDVDAHHDAKADAALAAEIGIRALKAETTWSKLAETQRINIGHISANSWRGCHSKQASSSADLPTEPTPGVEIPTDHPLKGKTVAFTGALTVRRQDAQQAVVNVGGIAARGVTRKTDVLVTGFQDLLYLAAGHDKSSKFRKAEQLRAEGRGLEIVAEAEFIAMLGGTDPDEAGGERQLAGGCSTVDRSPS